MLFVCPKPSLVYSLTTTNYTMRTSTILRILPFKPRLPVAVAPLPEKTRFDCELSTELDTLGSQGKGCGGEIGLAQLLEAAITTQKIAYDSLVNISYRDISAAERGSVDKYLEENIEILDACNYFVEKMESINKYVDTLKVVVHLVDSGNAKPNSVATTRALELLESCQSVEKRMKKGNCGSYLKKLLRQRLCHETDLSEIMCGSKAMALMCCRFLELGLSLDSKIVLPTMKQSQPTSSSWLRLLQELGNEAEASAKRRSSMTELQQTVAAALDLKDQMKGKREKEMKSAVERLKRSCRELEDELVVIEERVKDLYKNLIDVRMILMGILSHA